MNYTFTLYREKRDSRGRPIEGSWAWWVREHFSTFAIRGTLDDRHADEKTLNVLKNGPCLVLGPIAEGQSHLKENVHEIHALAIDIDKRSESAVLQAIGELKDYAYAAYTTFKHGSDVAGALPRLRVVVPLAAPVLAKNFASVWLRMNLLVHNVNDPSTKDINRLHFLPCTFDRTLAEAWSNEGRFLSVEELPLLAPPGAGGGSVDYARFEANDAVSRIRRRMKANKAENPAFGLILKGDSFAEKSERHKTFTAVTWWIAKKERALSDDVIEAIFAASVDVMLSEDPEWGGMPDIIRSYSDAVTKLNKDAVAGVEPYSGTELQQIADVQGCPVEELSRRWIIQHGESFFFLEGSGYYSRPVNGREGGSTVALQKLPRAPVSLTDVTPNGMRPRQIADLVQNYGWYCQQIVVDLASPGTIYDAATDTLREATCPMRNIEPKYDPEIAEWLEKLVGGGSNYEMLLDWLAVFPILSETHPALYLKGKSSAGKGLLSQGLTRFWTTGAWTSLSSVFGSWNDKILSCPLIVADEYIPSNAKATAHIREMLASTEHELRRRYVASTSMHGAVRLVILANNPDLLRGIQNTPDDQEALVSRVVVLDAHEESAAFLSKLGGRKYLNPRWIEGDGIARHVAHLSLERAESLMSRGDRFAIHSTEKAEHREIFASKFDNLVRMWLTKYCDNPAMADSHPQMKELLYVREGKFLVNSEAVQIGWQMYLGMNVREEATLSGIGRALGLVSKPRGSRARVKRTMKDGSRRNFYPVDPETLCEFSEEHDSGSPESIRRTVARPAALQLVGGPSGAAGGTA